MEKQQIRELAKKSGIDEFSKLSDPPIPCYSCTERQMERFVELVEAEIMREIVARRKLGMSYPL